MSSLQTVWLGFWLLGSLLCLSFGTSVAAYNKGTSANLRECLNFSKYLMTETKESLNQIQGRITCTMETTRIPNPNNEAKIRNACMNGKSKFGLCFSGKNDTVNQTLCMETIHTILESYAEVIRHSKSFGFPKLLDAVNDLLQALKINNKTIEEAPYKPPDSFSVWFRQCKFLLTFQQLAETINRIMNYLRLENNEQNTERNFDSSRFF